MKSIDTYYKGNYFRSRLEAKWAVFFDLIGVEYNYEHNGFKDGNGEYYLPDFYLENVVLRDKENKGVYIEVKPYSFKEGTIKQAEWFDKNLVLVVGNPVHGVWLDEAGGDGNYQLKPFWDNCMAFWKCKSCGQVKIEFRESNYDCCPACGDVGGSHDFVRGAAFEATIKRFEHQ